jgi:hypothetical protein
MSGSATSRFRSTLRYDVMRPRLRACCLLDVSLDLTLKMEELFFLRNVSEFHPHYAVWHPTKLYSPYSCRENLSSLLCVLFSGLEMRRNTPLLPVGGTPAYPDWSISLFSLVPPRKYRHTYIFFFSSCGGVRLSPLGTSATNWPIVPAPDDRWWWVWSSRWNENWQGKLKYSEKTCPSATLSTTNSAWPDVDSNPGRRGGKPATNRLSYSTALYR